MIDRPRLSSRPYLHRACESESADRDESRPCRRHAAALRAYRARDVLHGARSRRIQAARSRTRPIQVERRVNAAMTSDLAHFTRGTVSSIFGTRVPPRGLNGVKWSARKIEIGKSGTPFFRATELAPSFATPFLQHRAWRINYPLDHAQATSATRSPLGVSCIISGAASIAGFLVSVIELFRAADRRINVASIQFRGLQIFGTPLNSDHTTIH